MTLTEYIAAFKRGWWIVLATFVLAVACVAVVVLRQPDVYSASTQMYVAVEQSPRQPGDPVGGELSAADRVASYVSVVSGSVAEQRVVDELGEDFDSTVLVAAVPATVVLQVLIMDPDPQQAADVAQAYADVVPGLIQEVEKVGDGGPQIRVTTIDNPELPTDPDAVSVAPKLVAAGIVGLGLGATIVVLREVLRRERRRAARGVAPSDETAGA